MRFRFPLKWGDFIVIAFFIFLGSGGIFYNVHVGTGEGNKYAEVYVEHELVKEISMNPGEERIYQVPFGEDNQHEAKVEVKDGQVRMLPISEELCPRDICSHTGWISREHESIACVPNLIFITITTGEEDEEIDGVTY